MEYTDISFEPLSDIGVDELDLVAQHNSLLKNNKYSDASALLSRTIKGFKASLFNLIQERLRKFELFILNSFVAEEGEYYSYNEPNVEEMPDGAIFFIQLIDMRKPFEFTVKNAHPLVIDDEGVRFFMSADTVGDNWTISDRTDRSILGTDNENRGYCRVFYNGDMEYLKLMNSSIEIIFDVDVINDGNYDITANVIRDALGGYAAVYVNDTYVGTTDSYLPTGETQVLVEQPLLGVHLNSGKNTIAVKSIGKSQGTKYYVSFEGFSFTTPEELTAITGITTSVDSNMMSVGTEQHLNLDINTTRDVLYDLKYSGVTVNYSSSKPSVATIDTDGKIVALSVGKTVIKTTTSTGFTDTVEITVV